MESKELKLKVMKIATIVLNALFYVFILLLLLFAIANMKVKTNADIPSLFSRGFLSVLTPSMDGNKEDSFKEGDLVIVDILNEKEKDELEIGDIITYYNKDIEYTTVDGVKKKGGLNTHRIVDIIDGFYITQGDRVEIEHPDRVYDPEHPEDNSEFYEIVKKEDILAQHLSTWSRAGRTLQYLQTPAGFGVWIVIPTFLLLVIEGILLIRNVLKYNKTKTKEQYEKEKALDLEKEKELIRKEILEEIRREQEAKKQ